LVIREYEKSPEFAQLRSTTQRDYSRYLTKLDHAAGDKLMREMPRRTIFQIRDRLAPTPTAANHMVAVIRSLYNFAIDREYADTNPTDRVGKLRTRGTPYKRWSERELPTSARRPLR
jgi:site-specific recombinase XerD